MGDGRSDWSLVARTLVRKRGRKNFVDTLVKRRLAEDPKVLLTFCRKLGIEALTVNYLGRYPIEVDVNGASISQSILRSGNFQSASMSTVFPDGADPDATFVNIGANIGTTCLNAHAAGFRKFIAVEPVARNADFLRRNLLRNGLDAEILQAAIGRDGGEAAINLNPRSGGRHSFKKAFVDGALETVAIRTLDSLPLKRPFHLWVDTEGHELDVLEGGQEALRDAESLCIEVTPVITGVGEADSVLQILDRTFSHFSIAVEGPVAMSDVRRRVAAGEIDQMDVICRR